MNKSSMFWMLGCAGLAVIAAARANARAAEPALRAVPIQCVSIDDPFWSPKREVWRHTTLIDCLDKFDRDGAMANFDHIARGEVHAGHGGPEWYDGLEYEMIRAAADFLAEQPNAALEARIDGQITRIAAAADHDPDGYVNTYTQLKEPDHRWGQNGGNDLSQHDLYNAGCLMDAGVHYYRATGKSTLLNASVRLANTMCQLMGPAPRQNIIPGHAMGEEAMVGLFQLFKEQPALKAKMSAPVDEQQYLALAQFWIDARGHHEGRKDFGAYDQDDVPVLQQQAISGHAVRATLMCSGLTALGMASSSPDYLDAAQRLWSNMVGKRMYVTGGVGSFTDQEKFGPDYVLPNNGHAETCAAVGNAFFDHNINLATGDAAAVDELERSLYNGSLAGVSLAGNTYFYENPLESGTNRLRWPWHGCPCCPPMFLKLMSALPGCIYATDNAKGIYVNLFVGSKATIDIAGSSVVVEQTTHYPWAGDVRLVVNPSKPTAFDLNVRVPGWCRGGQSSGGLYNFAAGAPDAFKMSINGEDVSNAPATYGYVRLHRNWKRADLVEIRMAMPVQRVTADSRVDADRGRVALMRGPIVYCLESIDNGGRVRDLFLPDSAAVAAEERADLLGGVTVLRTTGRRLEVDGEADTSADITAIPYYANANRGPVSMTVWVPTVAEHAMAPTIASLAKPSASHCNPSDSLHALNDGGTPESSSDDRRPRFTWWDHTGSAEWVQYDLDRSRAVSGVEVYWWDETRVQRECRVPQSWRILSQKPDGTWQPVSDVSEYGTRTDAFNTTRFTPVETAGLRIEVQLQPHFSGGILQWRVLPGTVQKTSAR